jgi:hypothetical protein
LGETRGRDHYERHPDPNQEKFFLDLLRECVAEGKITRDLLKEHMAKNYIRHDILKLLDAARPLAAE